MKNLYYILLVLVLTGLNACYESRIVTIQDVDGIEKPVKTVKSGSIIFTNCDFVYAGKSGNIIYFDLRTPNNPGYPSPYKTNRLPKYDLSKNDTIRVCNHTIRVVSSSNSKLMFIDYSQLQKFTTSN